MSQTQTDLTPTVRYNARVGMILFIVYSIIYAGFVALSAFAPAVMAKAVISGVNLAVVYGFSLIGLAFALAILYLKLCRHDRPMAGESSGENLGKTAGENSGENLGEGRVR